MRHVLLVRALELGIYSDRVPYLINLYNYPFNGSDPAKIEYFENFIKSSDNRIIDELRNFEQDSKARDIFIKLQTRKLYKRIFQKSINEFQEKSRVVIPQLFDSKKGECERCIAEWLNSIRNPTISSDEVILHYYSIESVRTQSRNSESSVLIRDNDTLQPFEEKSAVFRSMNEGLKEEFVECYAPIVYKEDERDKNKLIEDAKGHINDIIESVFGSDTHSVTLAKEA